MPVASAYITQQACLTARQQALSLVDLLSWVSRCIQAVSSSELQEVMASSHVFDRASGRSVVLSFAGVSMARLRWRSQ